MLVPALGTGCGELRARYTIQKADELYYASKYDQAIKEYEEALSYSDLAIGHHNAALANFKAFRAGDQSPANLKYADEAAAHFQKYLEQEPNDRPIRLFLTRIWVDSGKFEKAIAFWEQELKGDPKNVEILSALSKINLDSGNVDKSLEWMDRRVEAETTTEGKVTALIHIGRIQWGRMQKPDMVDFERLKVADIGIAALERAIELAPENKEVHATMASLYKQRSLTHGAGWAAAADQTSQFHHNGIWSELAKKEAGVTTPSAGEQPPAAPAPAPKAEDKPTETKAE